MVQYVTVALTFLPVILALSAWKKYEEKHNLTGERLQVFKKQCHEALAQYLTALGFPIGYAVLQTIAGNQQLATNLTNGYLAAVALAGLASLWNVYKAHRDTQAALKQRNVSRQMRLENVKDTNLYAYTLALVSVILGTIGIYVYNKLPAPPPSAWFIAFLLTAAAAKGLLWSTAAATVAAAYESNPKMGKDKKSKP